MEDLAAGRAGRPTPGSTLDATENQARELGDSQLDQWLSDSLLPAIAYLDNAVLFAVPAIWHETVHFGLLLAVAAFPSLAGIWPMYWAAAAVETTKPLPPLRPTR